MRRILLVLALAQFCFGAPAAKTAADPLGRDNPRSAVTHFLEWCHQKDYGKASQYLDLSQLPAYVRAQQGQQLAKDLESVLNADKQFDALDLTDNPHGPPDGLVTLATVKKDSQSFPFQLKLTPQKTSPDVWLLSAASVALLPKVAPVPSTESVIEARLPRFLVSTTIAETPIWIWITLLIAAAIITGLVRLVASVGRRCFPGMQWRALHAWLEPALVLVATVCFRIAEQSIVPTALARTQIERFLLLVAVWAVGWALVNLVELFLTRLDAMLDARQRVVSHSLIYLGRRTSRVVVFVIGAVFVLNAWGFPMTTVIAGLGVGGIAIALAAQQTIANVFGGVSVIGDHPVMVGDFGNFGGVIGYVDDIGLRSTRIRTLNRTVVSVPNSAFAGMNLENYSVRDKMLFNPTLSVKRATPKAQIQKATDSISAMLKQDRRIEPAPTSVRITAISAAAFSVEIFSYIKTMNPDEFYRIASDLYLKIDDELSAAGVELV